METLIVEDYSLSFTMKPVFLICWGLKQQLAYLQFFFIWTQVLNHNKYVEIKQYSKVDIKQNNISTVILLIKFPSINEIRVICKEVGLFTYLFT